jgi:hypothetical protein
MAMQITSFNVTRDCAAISTDRRFYFRTERAGHWTSMARPVSLSRPAINLRKGSRLDRALDRFCKAKIEAGIRSERDA